MGKLFEALRQPFKGTAGPADQALPILCPPEDDEPQEADQAAQDEVPFIEVGPRHSVEGSPDVLRCAPPPAMRIAPPPPPQPQPPSQPQVRFRPMPLVASARAAEPRRSRLAAELVAFHAPDQAAASQYRELLGSLLPACATDGEDCPVLLFTGCREGAGATTVVLNTALTAARAGGRRVIVVDYNLRGPAVAERLGLPAVPGLREVLSGATSLEQALQETEQEGLFALTAGRAEPGSGTRFVAQTTRSLLRQLRQSADLVLIDGPPWEARPEVTALGAAADAVCLVVPEAEAEADQTDRLLQAIREQGACLAGCVLAGR